MFLRVFARHHLLDTSSAFLRKGKVFKGIKTEDDWEWIILIRVMEPNHLGGLLVALYEFFRPVNDEVMLSGLVRRCEAKYIDNRDLISRKRKLDGTSPSRIWKCPSELLPLLKEIEKDVGPDFPIDLTDWSCIFMRLEDLGSWENSIQEPKPRWVGERHTHYACLFRSSGDLLLHYQKFTQPMNLIQLQPVGDPIEKILLDLKIPEEWKISESIQFEWSPLNFKERIRLGSKSRKE